MSGVIVFTYETGLAELAYFQTMRALGLVAIAYCFSTLCFCQNASLVEKNLLDFETAKSESDRIYALAMAAFNSAHSNQKAGIAYGRRALEMAKAADDLRRQGDCHNSIGMCFEGLGMVDSSLHHFDTAILRFSEAGENCEIGIVKLNVGNAHKRGQNLPKALEAYSDALKIQEECGEKAKSGTIIYSIGVCYNAMKEYEKAIAYFEEGLALNAEFDREATHCNFLNGIGNAQLGLKNYGVAQVKFREALTCNRANGNKFNQAYSLESLAMLYTESGNLDSAITSATAALSIFREQESVPDIVFELNVLADILIKSKDYTKAETALKEASELAKVHDLSNDLATVYEHFKELYHGKGDYQLAFSYFEKEVALKDSLQINEMDAESKALAATLETEKRDRQIAVEQAQKQQFASERDRQKEQKYFFMAAAILLFLIAILFISRVRNKQRSAKSLSVLNGKLRFERDRAESNEKMKQNFLANMSHEIRTPVNAMNGLSKLLLDTELTPKGRTYLEAIHHSGNNLIYILNDILDLASVEAGKLKIRNEPFRLKSELMQLIKIYETKAEAKALELRFHAADTLPEIVRGDMARLAQVVGNLLSNAINFTEAGYVFLRVECTQAGLIKFSVADTGIGIATEAQSSIFKSFEQVKTTHQIQQGGSGLGLAISKELVRLMGGELKVSSAAGKGATFYFEIPLPTSMLALDEHDLAAELPAQSDAELHIIIAEDNDYNFMVAEGFLMKYLPNSVLYRAHHGEELLSLIREDDFDLIITDVRMPKLDGISATRILRAEGITIPIIGLSASVLEAETAACIAAGMDTFVHKPIQEQTLLSAIWQCIGATIPEPKAQEDDGAMKERVQAYLFQRLPQLRRAAENKDLEKIKDILHQIRPQAVQFGLRDMDHQFLKIDTAPALNLDVQRWVEEIEKTIQSAVDGYKHNWE